MTSDATVPSERELTGALLALSWPLPRTVEDARSALDRLEEVRTVLSRIEQESVGTEAWWAGQVDALCTQSGFVLEWWLPVLRDPDLDWTLNHQAHLTADLATLASAGARLLDQLEPSDEAREASTRGRRGGASRDWGPAAVPPFAPARGRKAPGTRPQPPSEVFGDMAGAAGMAAPAAQDVPAALRQDAGVRVPPPAAAVPDESEADTVPSVPTSQSAAPDVAPPGVPSIVPGFGSSEAEPPASEAAPDPPPVRSSSAEDLEAPDFPPLPGTPPTPAAPSDPSSDLSAAAAAAAAARHRRPSYDFDDPSAAAPPPAVFPPRRAPGGAPHAPGTPRGPYGPPAAFPGAPPQGYPPQGSAAPFGGRADEDDDEQGRVVPTGLRRHQRRLLVQTGLILAAIGGLCWWAVYSLSEGGSHSSAAGSPHTTAAPAGTGAAGLTVPGSSAAPTASHGPGSTPGTSSPPSAPATATAAVPDGTTATSVQATLLGGSSAVPQIVALVTVRTEGTGSISVTASYYGQSGSGRVAPESRIWTLAGKTAYQFSVPIANSPYCGGTFHFTLSAGGRSSSASTSPGC